MQGTMDAATAALHAQPCPGCGCEPEVSSCYLREDVRCGYHCACDVIVIDGMLCMHALS